MLIYSALYHFTGQDIYNGTTHRKVIRLNWLCNPTGKAHAFRAVDWLVERNNLYTKVSVRCINLNISSSKRTFPKQVIYAGTGPNRTIEHIIQESTLIELYRDCHVTVENGFYLEHRTIRHTHPDMTKTLRKLRTAIERSAPHHFTKGRRTKLSIPDQIAAAMNTMQKKKDPTANDNDEVADVEADDLMDD
jgi:hypothetical protein